MRRLVAVISYRLSTIINHDQITNKANILSRGVKT